MKKRGWRGSAAKAHISWRSGLRKRSPYENISGAAKIISEIMAAIMQNSNGESSANNGYRNQLKLASAVGGVSGARSASARGSNGDRSAAKYRNPAINEMSAAYRSCGNRSRKRNMQSAKYGENRRRGGK